MTKKLLLGSTALIAVSLVSSTASAQIEMRLGGFMNQWFGFGDNDSQYNLQDVDQWSNTEVFFLGQGTTDNGLTFGVNIQLEGNTTGDQIDESFLFLSGNWGRFLIGSENSAGYLMTITAPNVSLPINSGSQTQHIALPALNGGQIFRSPFGSTTIEPARDNDGQKLTYFTPRFSGLQLGVSYLPDIDDTGGDRNALIADTDAYTNGISVGINYDNEFDGVGVQASGGFFYAEAPDGLGNVITPGGNSVDLGEDFIGYSAGAAVSFGGFEVGGSYAVVTEGVLTQQTSGDVSTTEGYGFDVGVSYGQGPWSVSGTYFYGEQDSLFDVGGKDEHESYAVGGRYNLGSSISLLASAGFTDFEGEDGTTSLDDNDGFFITGGIGIRF